MCCAFLVLVTLGPRFFGAVWWLIQPVRWQTAFNSWPTGLWWIWPVAGLLFVPWLTIMYVIVSPGGVSGFDWLWLGLAVAADVASYGTSARRKSLPGYSGY